MVAQVDLESHNIGHAIDRFIGGLFRGRCHHVFSASLSFSMKNMRVPRHLGTSCLFLLASCGGEAADPTVSVRDSAGIQIVTSNGDRTSRTLRWETGESPLIDIGARQDDSSHQLFRVRDVTRLPGGGIAVLDGGSKEIRFFSSGGEHERTVGAVGEGPGEYRSVAGLTLAGSDSLLVFDNALGRITVLDLEGRFVNSFRLQSTADPIHPIRLYRLAATTATGDLVLLPRAYPADMKPRPMVHWDSVPNLVYTGAGTLRDTVGEFSGMDIYATPSRTNGLTFGRYTSADVYGDELYITDGGDYEFRIYGIRGDLGRIVRLQRAPRKVTAADERALKDVRLARARDDQARRDVEESFRSSPKAEYKPWLSNLVVDRTGHVWVEEYQPTMGGGKRTWSVFAPDGQWLGSAELPAAFRVIEIGQDFILGVWRDDVDVEHVRLLSLTRNE